MPDRYHTLLLALLPLLGCPAPADSGDTADSGDSGVPTGAEQGCYTVAASTVDCPEPTDVPPGDVLPETCGAEVLSVDGAGVLDGCGWIGGVDAGTWCIYPITVQPPEQECAYGRPLVLGGAPRLAPLRGGRGWAAGPPATAQLDPGRAATWARIALAEHASAASFSLVVLELMAFGAPADLVADTQAAAADEVRHAQLAFGLASRYAGVALRPGPMPLGDLRIAADLAAFAAGTVREGCLAETVSALLVAEALDRETDPDARAALAVLARDESRHAALAWRTVRWAIDTAADPGAVRAAVAAAFATPPSAPGEGGLLPAEVAAEVVDRAWMDVILPAAHALLGAAATAAEHADA